MSLSIHRITGQRAINRTVQYDNRLTEFTNPPIHSGDLYVKSNLEVRGNIHSYGDLDISGNQNIGGNLWVYGNERVKGNLWVSGNETVVGNLDICGNERIAGTILASTFLPGQFINMVMIGASNTDISISSLGNVEVMSYSYTPKNANSYIIAEFQTNYDVAGGSGDYLDAELHIASTLISKTTQKWNATTAGGGGTRSGVIFPIMGQYTNANTAVKSIVIRVVNRTDSDVCIVSRNNSTWLKITEIGR